MLFPVPAPPLPAPWLPEKMLPAEYGGGAYMHIWCMNIWIDEMIVLEFRGVQNCATASQGLEFVPQRTEKCICQPP